MDYYEKRVVRTVYEDYQSRKPNLFQTCVFMSLTVPKQILHNVIYCILPALAQCLVYSKSLMYIHSVTPNKICISQHPSNHHLSSICYVIALQFSSGQSFSCESVLHIRWLKYWSFIFSISSSNLFKVAHYLYLSF